MGCRSLLKAGLSASICITITYLNHMPPHLGTNSITPPQPSPPKAIFVQVLHHLVPRCMGMSQLVVAVGQVPYCYVPYYHVSHRRCGCHGQWWQWCTCKETCLCVLASKCPTGMWPPTVCDCGSQWWQLYTCKKVCLQRAFMYPCITRQLLQCLYSVVVLLVLV